MKIKAESKSDMALDCAEKLRICAIMRGFIAWGCEGKPARQGAFEERLAKLLGWTLREVREVERVPYTPSPGVAGDCCVCDAVTDRRAILCHECASEIERCVKGTEPPPPLSNERKAQIRATKEDLTPPRWARNG